MWNLNSTYIIHKAVIAKATLLELRPKIEKCVDLTVQQLVLEQTMGMIYETFKTCASKIPCYLQLNVWFVCRHDSFQISKHFSSPHQLLDSGCPIHFRECRENSRFCHFRLSPPETGASMNTAPIFSAATAISLDTAGSIVLESMRRDPFFTFLLSKNTRLHLIYL